MQSARYLILASVNAESGNLSTTDCNLSENKALNPLDRIDEESKSLESLAMRQLMPNSSIRSF